MEKEFVPYNESLELNELGFNESCFGYYYTLNGKDWKFAEKSEYYRLDDELMFGPQSVLLVPTFSQAFRWFREKYKLFHSTIYVDDNSGQGSFIYEILDKKGNQQQSGKYPEFNTYEEAELECLRKLIEIVKNEKQKTN